MLASVKPLTTKSSDAGGILESVSESVVAVFIPEGAHHLDLMFSHPDDPLSVREARLLHKQHMHKWVNAHTSSLSTAR